MDSHDTQRERRFLLREPADLSAALSLEGKDLPCRVRNISAGGLLLVSDGASPFPLSMNDIGKNIGLAYTDSSGTSRTAKGILIRVIENGDMSVAAVKVLDQA